MFPCNPRASMSIKTRENRLKSRKFSGNNGENWFNALFWRVSHSGTSPPVLLCFQGFQSQEKAWKSVKKHEKHLESSKITKIRKFSKKKDWKGEITYYFGPGCQPTHVTPIPVFPFTFSHVLMSRLWCWRCRLTTSYICDQRWRVCRVGAGWW